MSVLAKSWLHRLIGLVIGLIGGYSVIATGALLRMTLRDEQLSFWEALNSGHTVLLSCLFVGGVCAVTTGVDFLTLKRLK